MSLGYDANHVWKMRHCLPYDLVSRLKMRGLPEDQKTRKKTPHYRVRVFDPDGSSIMLAAFEKGEASQMCSASTYVSFLLLYLGRAAVRAPRTPGMLQQAGTFLHHPELP